VAFAAAVAAEAAANAAAAPAAADVAEGVEEAVDAAAAAAEVAAAEADAAEAGSPSRGGQLPFTQPPPPHRSISPAPGGAEAGYRALAPPLLPGSFLDSCRRKQIGCRRSGRSGCCSGGR